MIRPRTGPPASIYFAGLFAMGYTDFYIFLIPLYGLSLGMSAGEIGMLVGGRSLLAVFLSIHVGVLMDRFGTRRVTLFFVWTAMAFAPISPLVPWFWPLLPIPTISRLRALLCAYGNPGGGDDNGHHVSAHTDQWRAKFALCCLSERHGADRHIDRHPVRGHRSRERI